MMRLRIFNGAVSERSESRRDTIDEISRDIRNGLGWQRAIGTR